MRLAFGCKASPPSHVLNLPYEPSGKPDVYPTLKDLKAQLSANVKEKVEQRWYHGSKIFRPLWMRDLFLFGFVT
ncbi:hypothetical protein BAOM_3617 [Peribacillus asahii]|uniref:Uncharacterized protein n=1 Tax=Peribacillus asahii TaxID=228899 RepID=A0A3T0KUZ6_9BACI|nr:hypothetical protein BAOM_3617 [Peribacillus asahii]